MGRLFENLTSFSKTIMLFALMTIYSPAKSDLLPDFELPDFELPDVELTDLNIIYMLE